MFRQSKLSELYARNLTSLFGLLKDFFYSFSTTRLFQRQHIRELFKVSVVLEGAGICEIFEISDVFAFFGFATIRTLS